MLFIYIYNFYIMKKALVISLSLSTLLLASCGSQAPLTEAQQAEKYNMSESEFQETKEAAARMNMTVEDHMKMTDEEMEAMDSNDMDMSDDSHMIEDDMEMQDDTTQHMQDFHKGQDVEEHDSDEHM